MNKISIAYSFRRRPDKPLKPAPPLSEPAPSSPFVLPAQSFPYLSLILLFKLYIIPIHRSLHMTPYSRQRLHAKFKLHFHPSSQQKAQSNQTAPSSPPCSVLIVLPEFSQAAHKTAHSSARRHAARMVMPAIMSARHPSAPSDNQTTATRNCCSPVCPARRAQLACGDPSAPPVR